MRAPRGLPFALAGLLAAFAIPPVPAGARPASGPQAELGSALSAIVGVDEAGGPVRETAQRGELVVTPGERVLVDVFVTGDPAAMAARLRAAGVEVRATSAGPPAAVVAGYVPVDRLEDLTRVPGVRGLRPVTGFGTDAGGTLSQGVAAHRAGDVGPVNGAGVKIGVISDSIDEVGAGLAASQASGDLPADVAVLSDQAGGSDEGRAMAEIIYDMAPGITQMAFATGTVGGAAGKAAAIDALVAAGAKIIADDIFFLSEPFFQDGVIAQAVDRARDAGVLYLASAGNRARQSYESTPRFAGGAPGPHDFDAGPGTDTVQTVTTVQPGQRLSIALQWGEPWGGAATDVDVLLVRADGTALPGAAPADGTTDNLSGPRLPSESATWTNTTASAVDVGVRIERFAGATPTTLKYIARTSSPTTTFAIAEHASHADTINPDAAAARGALAVAAVRHSQSGLNVPEPFSSRGPKTRLFDAAGLRLPAPEVRAKPELAGADGVATSVPGYESFFGTSAATPSAAGVAALALSARPSLSTGLLRALMTSPANALDCLLPGVPDTDCGAGFVLADRVVAQAQDTTPPALTPTVTPAVPTGANGWWTTDVGVTWGVSDPGSPVVTVDCPAVAHATDGARTAGCTATSVGGTAVHPGVTVRRDTTPPATPQITGIGATAYPAGALPAAGCVSSDATSGLAACTLSPVSTAPGTHVLTATATDQAGLTSTSSVVYTVLAPPPAAAPTAIPVATGPLVPAEPAVAGETASSPRERVGALVRLRSSKRCIRRRARPSLRIAESKDSEVRRVVIRVTGRRRAIVRRRAGRVTLPRVTRTRVRVQVTVTLANGRKATVKRTYRRC